MPELSLLGDTETDSGLGRELKNMHTPIIVALDYDELNSAKKFVDQINPTTCQVKVGKGMFTRFGPTWVRWLIQRGFRVFLDLKFHDIPKTVADACRAAADLGVWMLNVHVCGGEVMLQAARSALESYRPAERPLLIGITLLTSLHRSDLTALGITDTIPHIVNRYAKLAAATGLDGVVCSAQEVVQIKKNCGHAFLTVTPGIRLAHDASDDQKRIVTPEEALAAGADYLVIGRSITKAKNPILILQQLLKPGIAP